MMYSLNSAAVGDWYLNHRCQARYEISISLRIVILPSLASDSLLLAGYADLCPTSSNGGLEVLYFVKFLICSYASVYPNTPNGQYSVDPDCLVNFDRRGSRWSASVQFHSCRTELVEVFSRDFSDSLELLSFLEVQICGSLWALWKSKYCLWSWLGLDLTWESHSGQIQESSCWHRSHTFIQLWPLHDCEGFEHS